VSARRPIRLRRGWIVERDSAGGQVEVGSDDSVAAYRVNMLVTFVVA
jgi:hypothetical protein